MSADPSPAELTSLMQDQKALKNAGWEVESSTHNHVGTKLKYNDQSGVVVAFHAKFPEEAFSISKQAASVTGKAVDGVLKVWMVKLKLGRSARDQATDLVMLDEDTIADCIPQHHTTSATTATTTTNTTVTSQSSDFLHDNRVSPTTSTHINTTNANHSKSLPKRTSRTSATSQGASPPAPPAIPTTTTTRTTTTTAQPHSHQETSNSMGKFATQLQQCLDKLSDSKPLSEFQLLVLANVRHHLIPVLLSWRLMSDPEQDFDAHLYFLSRFSFLERDLRFCLGDDEGWRSVVEPWRSYFESHYNYKHNVFQ